MIRCARTWGFCGAVAIGLIPSALFAQAADPQLLSEHEDWAAYTYQNNKEGKVCYVVSQPKDSLPKNVRRDPVYFLVTNRPAKNVQNEVSVITGYPYKKGSTTTATIGSSKYSLFTSGDGAWVESNSKEKSMIAAMRRGANMVIKGTSWRGTLTTDTYSLKGITAAIKAINEACS